MMGDSEEVTDLTALQVSVSFGRFENDLLAWEKWSTFPSNKYLEEVEKCSTPGSVAQKKAYFEAHYKKIAARKAEQEDQDRAQGIETRDPVDSQVEAKRDLVYKFCEAEQGLDAEKLNNQLAVAGTELVANSAGDPVDSQVEAHRDLVPEFAAQIQNDQSTVNGVEIENEMPNSEREIFSDLVDELKDSDVTAIESNDSLLLIDGAKDDESRRILVSPELLISEESARVNDKASSLRSERVEELPKHLDNARDIESMDKEEKFNSEILLKSQKASAMKKETNTTAVKKKAAASVPKPSLFSTPKISRPTLSKSSMSESRASSKKKHGTSHLINRKPARAESQRAASTSLHMSLSLGPDRAANTEPAPTTTMRKSLFMEEMGDKDIVKRAFRAFRKDLNNFNSSSPGKATLASQIHGKDTGIKTSVVGTPQKKIDGSPHTSVGANQRNVKSVSSKYGLRSHDREPDKRKEKMEEKADGKATERTQIQSKVKKGEEIKGLSPDHFTKPKPILGTAKLKSSLNKKSAK